jgi:hypothetical protein
MFIDGRGEIVATEVRDPKRHKDYEEFAVVGNSEISRGPESHLVEQIDLTTRAVTPVGAGVLIAASHDHVALTACLSASRCVVASGPLSDPYRNRVEFGHPVPRGVLSADGRNLAFVRSELNGPEEVWVLDLTNGDSHMIHTAPDVPPLVGFTADGGHLVTIGTNPGTLNVIIVSDAHSLVIDLGERLRATGIRPTL